MGPYSTLEKQSYIDSNLQQTLREDPRRSTFLTLNLAERRPATSKEPENCITKPVHLGPGVKLVGGELRQTYADRPAALLKMGRTADFADMLQHHRQATATSKLTTSNLAQPATPPVPTSNKPLNLRHSSTPEPGRAVVYWDGKHHHMVRPGNSQEVPRDWKPPHLENANLQAGSLLGVRETPGAASTRLIGSKHRLLAPDANDFATMPSSTSSVPRNMVPNTIYSMAASLPLSTTTFSKPYSDKGPWFPPKYDKTQWVNVGRPSRAAPIF